MAFHHHNQRSIKMLVVGSRWDKVSLPKKREITHQRVARLFCRQCLNGLAVAHRPWLQNHLFRFWLSNFLAKRNEPSSLRSEVFVVRDRCKMWQQDVEVVLCAKPIKSDVTLTMVSYLFYFILFFLANLSNVSSYEVEPWLSLKSKLMQRTIPIDPDSRKAQKLVCNATILDFELVIMLEAE